MYWVRQHVMPQFPPYPNQSQAGFLQIGIPGLVVSHFLTLVVYGPLLPSVFIVLSQHRPHSGFGD